jgi:hypothetical protein
LVDGGRLEEDGICRFVEMVREVWISRWVTLHAVPVQASK